MSGRPVLVVGQMTAIRPTLTISGFRPTRLRQRLVSALQRFLLRLVAHCGQRIDVRLLVFVELRREGVVLLGGVELSVPAAGVEIILEFLVGEASSVSGVDLVYSASSSSAE